MKKIIALVVLVLALLIFSVFYVAEGSSEYKAKQIEKIFELNNREAIKLSIEKEFNRMKREEKIAIIDNLSFGVVQANKEVLIELLNLTITKWQEEDSFNMQYLKTEFDLQNRKNEIVIHDMRELTKKTQISSVSDFIKEVDIVLQEGWGKSIGDYFVVSGNNELRFDSISGKHKLVYAQFDVMDMSTGYVVKFTYDQQALYIAPTIDKIEDAGFYEISDVLSYFDIDQIIKFSNYKEKPIDNGELDDSEKGVDRIINTYKDPVFAGKLKLVIKDDIFSGDNQGEDKAGKYYDIRKRRDDYYLLEDEKSFGGMVYIASVSVEKLEMKEKEEVVTKSVFYNVFRDSLKVYQHSEEDEESKENDSGDEDENKR